MSLDPTYTLERSSSSDAGTTVTIKLNIDGHFIDMSLVEFLELQTKTNNFGAYLTRKLGDESQIT